MLNVKSPTAQHMDSTTHCDDEYYSQILGHEDQLSDKLQLTKSSLDTKILQLQTLVTQCQQVETLNIVKTHIQAAITVIKALKNPHSRNILRIKRKFSPNANNKTQP